MPPWKQNSCDYRLKIDAALRLCDQFKSNILEFSCICSLFNDDISVTLCSFK
jgi:hypothetical protein